MRPEPGKKRETSSPLSASRAISSAATVFVRLCVLFIQSLFLAGGFPKGYQVVILAFFVFANFEDHGVKRSPNPSDCAELLGEIGASIQIIWTGKNLLRLFKADPAFRVLPQLPALARIEVESHKV